MGIYLKIFNTKQWSVAKAALINAGLLNGTPDKVSPTQDFINQLQQSFPQVYQGIKDGITIYQTKTMSGGDKAVAIAKEVLETAPAVLATVPGIKDAMVSAVTTIFADQFSSFNLSTLQNILKR